MVKVAQYTPGYMRDLIFMGGGAGTTAVVSSVFECSELAQANLMMGRMHSESIYEIYIDIASLKVQNRRTFNAV